jgi:hypothetical protein
MGIRDFLTMKDGHCELSAFFTFFGIVAFVTLLVMYFIFQMVILNNLVVLFGFATLAGIIAVIIYRYTNQKFPFSR